jgi:hypothetical protein
MDVIHPEGLMMLDTSHAPDTSGRFRTAVLERSLEIFRTALDDTPTKCETREHSMHVSLSVPRAVVRISHSFIT